DALHLTGYVDVTLARRVGQVVVALECDTFVPEVLDDRVEVVAYSPGRRGRLVRARVRRLVDEHCRAPGLVDDSADVGAFRQPRSLLQPERVLVEVARPLHVSDGERGDDVLVAQHFDLLVTRLRGTLRQRWTALVTPAAAASKVLDAERPRASLP